MLKLGCAQRDITPTSPVPLAGFGFRKGVYENIHSSLTLTVFILEQEDKTIMIIHGDLLWWGNDTVENFQSRLKTDYPHYKIVFHATHTHCAPHVSSQFADDLGKPNLQYIEILFSLVKEAIQAAEEDMQLVRIFRRDGQSNLPINRRRKNMQGLVEMQPNPEGSVDRGISLITFETEKGIHALWLNASCHPTCSGDNRVSAEFQTMALQRLFPKNSAYFQGFCGDTRPKIIKDESFYRGALDKESEEQSNLFLQEIECIYSSSKKEISPNLYYCEELVNVPYAKSFPHENYKDYVHEPSALGQWARFWEKIPKPSTQEIRLMHLSLGKGLDFLALNGEVVTDYSLALKQRFPGLICLGYTNGMIAYIPTATQIKEGGYEAYNSMFWFMRPAPFSEQVEEILVNHCVSLLSRS